MSRPFLKRSVVKQTAVLGEVPRRLEVDVLGPSDNPHLGIDGTVPRLVNLYVVEGEDDEVATIQISHDALLQALKVEE